MNTASTAPTTPVNGHTVPARASGAALRFPPNFLWGAATAATQVEGHITNEWTDFVAPDGNTCQIACDHYHRYPEDIDWMVRLGLKAYRMGIEWSRLQSAPYAPLNHPELDRYCDLLDRLQAAGITPMVVLHHFSNPPWISAARGWRNPETVPIFVDYVTKLVAALRSRVRIWNTFNEPDTYASCTYMLGEFPPHHKGRFLAFRSVIKHMAAAHRQVCHIIRQQGSPLGPVEVGFTKNWTFFEAYPPGTPWDRCVAGVSHYLFNHFVIQSFMGKSHGPGENSNPDLGPDSIGGAGSPLPAAGSPAVNGAHGVTRPTRQHADAATYLGWNYYGRVRYNHFRPLVPARGLSRETLAKMGVICDDMFERHPPGMESALLEVWQKYQLPIYITEHGSASTDEAFRATDLRENLTALHRAITRGADVRGFFYWSLLDNFEWQFGYSKKFGLIEVDFKNPGLTRKMKPLGEIYKRVCEENGIG